MKSIIVMHEKDNVGNALEDIRKGDDVSYATNGQKQHLVAQDDVPFGFKVALRDIAPDADIVKYKEVIGMASRPIKAGECVHIHNVKGKRGRGDLEEAQA
ncbi:MAG: UxaA family hydrolase [Desulfovibrionaceae bacterium]|jgi:altronate dehydratase small subunit|nr:UxaA family hydrolase [Desulfovibrionaceae bacterium]